MTAPTPEEVERVAREMHAAANDATFHTDWNQVHQGFWRALARWHLARVQPAPDERRKRVVETARAVLPQIAAARFPGGYGDDEEGTVTLALVLAEAFVAREDAYLNGGAS